MWVILNNTTSTDFSRWPYAGQCPVLLNLITTCSSPLTATRVCLKSNTPLCLHVPLLGYSHNVGSWHSYHMVTSYSVCIKNLNPFIKLKYRVINILRSLQQYLCDIWFTPCIEMNSMKFEDLKICIQQGSQPIMSVHYMLNSVRTHRCLMSI